ncbi:hypothetical protein BJX63DRAFT_293246 [Aspergillus granulosus]|uniref:Uncharacterized protein n=1 Tax=Aspergillus granulosus TaxID=176169 RepID=A0ABR4H8M6_9EURO
MQQSCYARTSRSWVNAYPTLNSGRNWPIQTKSGIILFRLDNNNNRSAAASGCAFLRCSLLLKTRATENMTAAGVILILRLTRYGHASHIPQGSVVQPPASILPSRSESPRSWEHSGSIFQRGQSLDRDQLWGNPFQNSEKKKERERESYTVGCLKRLAAATSAELDHFDM